MWKQSIRNFDLKSVHWHTQARLIDWTHIYIENRWPVTHHGKGIHHSKKGRGELKLGLPYYMKFSRISQYKKNREIKVTRTISVANTTGREN